MKFTKMHGLGNDFIVVDMWQEKLAENPSRLAQNICHRHVGVGADGLVLIHPSARADCRMQIFNADGSEAESCGNALRCVAKYVFEVGRTRGNLVTIEALAGIYSVEVTAQGGLAQIMKVNMGVPRFEPQAIPALVEGEGPVLDLALSTAAGNYRGALVNTGVPHVVIFLPSLTGFDYVGEGRQLEQNPLFPKGINVDFVEVQKSDLLRVVVWERGAGPTLACGTGASAALVAAHLKNLSSREATVSLPGGPIRVKWDNADGCVYIAGPAAIAFTGDTTLPTKGTVLVAERGHSYKFSWSKPFVLH